MSELLELPLYSKDKGKNVIVSFFMSTYGEGEPTDNAVDFWEWIQNCVENDVNEDKPLKDLSYVLFGLGNKTYEFYNLIGRELNKILKNWGGASIIGEFGEGDDNEDTEGDFQEWKEKMYPCILNYFQSSSSETIENDEPTEFTSSFNIKYIDDINSQKDVFIGELSRDGPRRWGCKDNSIFELNNNNKQEYDVKHPFYAKVSNCKQLFQDCYDSYRINNDIKDTKLWDQDVLEATDICKVEDNKINIKRECLHFDIDISNSNITYNPGDHVAIYPRNNESIVNNLINLLGVTEKADTLITLEKNPKSKSHNTPNISMPCTIRTALTYYLDINAVLKIRQFEIISGYTENSQEKEYYNNIIENFKNTSTNMEKYHKTLSQILKECPETKIPIEVVLGDLLPKITPRYYSISSSPNANPNTLSVTAILVRYPLFTTSSPDLKLNKMVYSEGLCTGYLNSIYKNSQKENAMDQMINELNYDINTLHPPKLMIPISIRESTFKLPRDTTLPIIMIGPGTGIAPFRGFIQERLWQAKQGKNVGKTILFYGCRNRNQDYLYRQELEDIKKELDERKSQNDNNIKSFDLEIINAFSRETDKKVYVQHRLAEHGEIIWELIREKRAHIYICGDASNMARDVQACIENIAKTVGGMGENQANILIKDLKLKGRFHEDVW
jgi:NADPH-ferrihemoprotein reductase